MRVQWKSMQSAIAMHDRRVNELNRAALAAEAARAAAKKSGRVVTLADYRSLPPPPVHPESGRVRRR